MDRHSIVLRAANPTFDEGLAFARYLDEAAEGFFRFMLGRRAGYITSLSHRTSQPPAYLAASICRFLSFAILVTPSPSDQ